MYDDLVKALRNNADHYGFVGENGLVHLLVNAADAIETLKADARPAVRGKWKKRRFTELAFGYECTVCHTTWDVPTNFCPNCGADMREES